MPNSPTHSQDQFGSQQSDTRAAILYIIGSLDLGGSERHLAMIMPRLRRRGWRPIIYCLSHRGVQAQQLKKEGIEVVGPFFECNSGPAWVRGLCLLLSCLRLFTLMLVRRPRFVHFFLPMSYIIGAPLAILARLRFRLMSRRSLNFYQRNHKLSTWMELRLHNRMNAVLSNSKAVARDLESEGCDKRRIGLIYNGIDTSEIDSFVVSTNTISGTRPLTMLIVANLIPYKGHTDLFHALKSVSIDLPSQWVLNCAGRDDGIGNSLLDLARKLNIQDHVRLLGERQDIPALLKSADIGILSSHEEGFSNAVLEGMAAGLPMVVTDVGGNSEAVVDGSTGFVVPARSPEALGRAILKLAADSALQKKMGLAARNRLEQHFTIEQCIDHYDDLYLMLERCGSPSGIAIGSGP